MDPNLLQDEDLLQDPILLQEQNILQDREPTIFNSFLILFFVVLTLFIALLFRQNDLSLLAILVLSLMGGAKAWSALSLAHVSCTTQAAQKRIFAGETLLMTTMVTNKKFLPIWVRLQWPARNLAVIEGGKAITSAQEAGILWHQQASFLQNLTALRRGVYTAGPSHIQTSDFFGFFRSGKNLQKANTIIVYPKLVDVKKVNLPRRDLFGKPGNQNPVKDPVYITGTRDYQASSPARHIHWKASARHARLQEKVFEPSQQGKIMMVLEVDGFSNNSLEHDFERTLEVIASLCLQLETSGLAVGFATNGSAIGGDFSLIPTGQGPQQVPDILEALARVQIHPEKTLAQTLQKAVLPIRGISCICFAGTLSPELNRMRQACQQKKIPLAVFVHQPGGNAVATEKEAISGIPLIQDLLVLEDTHS